MSSPSQVTVVDAPGRQRYEIRDGDHLLGIAGYTRSGDRWTFVHTEVHTGDEHHGLGGQLVRAALDDVRANGGRVVAQCPFVAGWIARHPDHQDLLVTA